MRISRFILPAALAVLAATTALVPARAQMTGHATTVEENVVMVGGAAMYPARNIIQNAVNSKDHTTLVAAVKAAGLVQTLQGPGPFTVFAPTNEAFDKLPPGTVTNLLKPENKPMLASVLTYHVVAGRYTEVDLMQMVKAGGGTAMLKTVEGEPLTITWGEGRLWVKGEGGGVASITVPDVMQSNGVIQVVSAVLLPK
ncbi:MAG TPA: fasciclin domain-containing protein [Acetobacteraceae bacterium]|jgi:uncharacterized surface protein with fasciclin (FAS1) repeats